MESSFYRGIKKLKKAYYKDKSYDPTSDIKELLNKNIKLDPAVLDDMYHRYCGSSDNIFDSAAQLSDMVDLFNEDYDELNDPLEEDDWIYAKTLVDANAEDMDLDLITYIMRLIVDKGFI